MKLKENSSEQKLRGGYYTPDCIADFIVKWAFPINEFNQVRILEPSCGDGAFLESVIRNSMCDNLYCKGIELLDTEATTSRKKVEGQPGFEIVNSDFYMEFNNGLNEEKFNLVLGNPPYIRYQYLTPEQRTTQSNILVNNGMKSNKLINSWVSFMVASVELLAPNGKIGMVIPAELLQVAYAEDLRKFLVDNLSQITVVTFEELVFPDVQQEVVLFLAEKSNKNNLGENLISVVQMKNLQSLEDDSFFNMPIEYKEVDHTKDKWTKYFLTSNEIKLINKVKANPRFSCFSNIASVDVGVTTGNNKYFSIDFDTVNKYDMQDVVMPLIGRSAHSKGLYFNVEDWNDNVKKGLNAHLINFPDIPFDKYPESHKDYIALGEFEDVDKGYKCGIRGRWYRIPSIYIPDAFFLRRNNKYPKFVLNNINAISTDTMHRVRFKEGIDRNRALLSYYNSLTFAFTEIEGRSYGGGVLEILPGEVEKVVLPDISNLDYSIVELLISTIDACIRANDDIEPVLDVVDRTILIDYMGLNSEEVVEFRNIWKRLMNRRLNRKG